MIKYNSGYLVYTNSVQGKIAIPLRSAYTASKHALQAWCDSARAELSLHNIQVLVINPSYIQTALSLNALTGSGQKYGSTVLFLLFLLYKCILNLFRYLSIIFIFI